MNSIWDENYSITRVIYLFSFLLLLTTAPLAQEIVWSQPGVGARPYLTILGSKAKDRSVMVSSPFGNAHKAYSLSSGELLWSQTLTESCSFHPLPLVDSVLIQGDQGTLWALDPKNGEVLWQSAALRALDYPIVPAAFREGFLFHLGRRGTLERLNRRGKSAGQITLDTSWGRRRATAVPLENRDGALAYLDQSGHFVRIDPQTLDAREHWFHPNDVTKVSGHTREVLAGCTSDDGQLLWTAELPGELRCIEISSGASSWTRAIPSGEKLWSKNAQLLALPRIVGRDLVLLSQEEILHFDPLTGRVRKWEKLPSLASAPPLFKGDSKSWWLLCQEHLLTFRDGTWNDYSHSVAQDPHSLEVSGPFAIIADQRGRVYGLNLAISTKASKP